MDELLLDDKLDVYALKCSTDGRKQRLPLSPDWRYESYPYKVLSYWNRWMNSYISVDDYDKLRPEQRRFFTACYEYRVPGLPDNIHVILRDNRVIIRIVKLSYEDEFYLVRSRKGILVDVVSRLRPGIFPYNPQFNAAYPRGILHSLRESSRYFLKKHFKPLTYEIGILITDPDRGLAAYNEWKQRARNTSQPGSVFEKTVYLTGKTARKEGGETVTVYDHGALHNRTPGLYKIEVIYRRKAFKKLSLSINDFDSQEDCMAPFKEDFVQRLMKLSSGPVTHEIALAARDLVPLASLVRSAREVKCA